VVVSLIKCFSKINACIVKGIEVQVYMLEDQVSDMAFHYVYLNLSLSIWPSKVAKTRAIFSTEMLLLNLV